MSAQTSAEAADSSATTTTNTTRDAGSGAIDNHRCGTCRQEFRGLPEFLQHKLNTEACRDSELSDWWEQQKKTLLAQGQGATGVEKSRDVRSGDATQAAASTGLEDTNDDMEEGEVRAGTKQRGATIQAASSEDDPSDTPQDSVTLVQAGRRSARHAARQAMEAAKKSASMSLDEDNRSSTSQSYTCVICSKHFQNSYYLHKHELSHREGKTVGCNKCDKFFRRPSDLRAHQRSHRSTRPYSCEVCGRSFKQQQVLRAHLKTHADRRDFKCSRCGDEFKTKGSLKRHERRHTGERPYKCNKCGRGFSESGALLRHHKALIPCTEKARTSNFSQVRIHPVENPDAETLGQHMTRSRTRNAGNVEAEDAGMAAGDDGSGAGDDGNREAGDDGIDEDEAVGVELGMTSVEGQLEGVQVEEATTAIEGEEPLDSIEEGDSEGNDLHSPKEPPNQCRVCKMVLTNSHNLKLHLLAVHLQNTPFRCGLCAFCTGERSDLQKHMLVKHRRHLGEGQYLDVVQVDSQGNIQPLPRPHDKRMPEMTAGDTEEETAADLLGEAMANSGISSDETEMVDAAMNTEETSLDVDGNPAASAALEQLLELQHMMESTSQPPVQDGLQGRRALHRCPHEGCNRSFRGSSYLKLHLRSHTGERPFKCSMCEGHFVSRDSLKRHIVTHTDERRYKCGECGKLYKRISHVKEHLRVHCPDKPFQCPHCKKHYKTQSSLRVHLRTHENAMPFSCEFCDRSFREKASLVRHLRTHTGEKPFKCTRCNRGFAEHGTLRRHLRSKGGCRVATSSSQAQGLDAGDAPQAEEVPTVLVEFSSMVADTQSYIIQGSDHGQDGGADGHTQQTIQVMEGVTNDQLVEALRMAQASGEVQELQVQQGEAMDMSDQHGASVVVTSEVVHIDPSVIMTASTHSAGDLHNLRATAEMVPQVTVSEVMGQDGGQVSVSEVMGHAGGEGLDQEVTSVEESTSGGMVNMVKLAPSVDDGSMQTDIETVVVEMH
ncbi:transcription factor E4F1-like isoform X1 [Branchiostoma lanceolatum]|uniref:transcription factor E4F1-like isoform X1 n=1 Tax=Branchiostoma lanceolatum TaxID=7740 RepID=UPI0034538775